MNLTLLSELNVLNSRSKIFSKLREAKGVKGVPVYIYSLATLKDIGKEIVYYKSVRQAAKYCGLAPLTIFSYLDTYIPYKGDFYFLFFFPCFYRQTFIKL